METDWDQAVEKLQRDVGKRLAAVSEEHGGLRFLFADGSITTIVLSLRLVETNTPE